MDTAIFLVSKFAGALIKIETTLAAAAVLTVFWSWRRRHKLARLTAIATAVLILVLSMLPTGNWLITPLERAYPASPALDNVTGIIVLGGAEDYSSAVHTGRIELNAASERLIEALELARRFPQARLVATGRSGAVKDEAGPGDRAMGLAERFLTEQGIAPARLVIEARSRNTSENAKFSYELVEPKDGETWVLVTSAFHMPRAMKSFERQGWNGLVAWPVDYRGGGLPGNIDWDLAGNLELTNLAIKEYIGQVAYNGLGR